MEAPLRRLRQLAGPLPTGEKRSDPQSLLHFLAKLTKLPAVPALQLIRERYVPAVEEQGDALMRLRLLEGARPEIERCLPELEQAIEASFLPLPTETAATAVIADNCLKDLAFSYCRVVAGLSDCRLDNGLARLLQQSTYRAMHTLLRRQMLAYRAYARPSSSSWQIMHDLYGIARAHGVATLDGEGNIERLYLCALLMAYAEPGKIPRHSLNALRQAVELLSPFAGIIGDDESQHTPTALAGRFWVRTDRGHPGRPLIRVGSTRPPVPGSLIVECRGVISALDRKLAQGLGSAHDIPENVLTTLRASLGGPLTRRFSRTQFSPQTRLVAGMDNALALIAACAKDEGALDAILQNGSEWRVLDESPDGFGIRYLDGTKWPLQAGDLVVLQTSGGTRPHVCLVRRIANLKSRLELGLQMLSPEASIIEIGGSEGKPHQMGLFLPRLPAFGGSAGLLASPGALSNGALLRCETPEGGIGFWKRGAHSEHNGQVEFHVLAPANSPT